MILSTDTLRPVTVTREDRALFIELFDIPERRHAEVMAGCKDELRELQLIARHRIAERSRCAGHVT